MQQMTCGESRERKPLASFRSRAKSRARSHLDVVPELAPAPVALLWLRPRPDGQAGENGRAEVANAVPKLLAVGHPRQEVVETPASPAVPEVRDGSPHAISQLLRRLAGDFQHAAFEVRQHAVQVAEDLRSSSFQQCGKDAKGLQRLRRLHHIHIRHRQASRGLPGLSVLSSAGQKQAVWPASQRPSVTIQQNAAGAEDFFAVLQLCTVHLPLGSAHEDGGAGGGAFLQKVLV
eukprot:scaffold7691_cov267-Pinguiococcus_pyrenoidosus.AAC.3